MDKLVDKVFMYMQTVRSISVNFIKITRMDRAARNGPTEQCLKVNLEMERNMEKVHSDGLMAVVTRANLITIRSAGQANTLGRIVGPTKEVGSIIRWTDLVFSPGLMAKCTKGNTKMTINMVMGSSFGPMENYMRECGGKAFNMEKE